MNAEQIFQDFLHRLKRREFIWEGIDRYETAFLLMELNFLHYDIIDVSREKRDKSVVINRGFVQGLVKYAWNPESIILLHNHPTNKSNYPSQADYNLEEAMQLNTTIKYGIVTSSFQGCIFCCKSKTYKTI